VDCGEGTQRQLLRSSAGFRRLDRLLLTHGHFDHGLGIPGSSPPSDCSRAPRS
jgi:ribonuclease Z